MMAIIEGFYCSGKLSAAVPCPKINKFDNSGHTSGQAHCHTSFYFHFWFFLCF